MSDGDKLVLEGMEFFGHHGDVQAERELGSRIYVDVEISADLAPAGRSDDLADTLDYVRCFDVVRRVVEEEQHRLLETVAARVAQALLEQPRARHVRVRVAKQPPLPGVIARTAVIVERGTA
ncbi:MAG: dihydroneopterin aldolase [Candidatus Dormibacteria bacterium]